MSNKLHNARSLYLEGIRDGNVREAVEKYTGDHYTQHSTGVRDGKEGFLEFFGPFTERNPIRHIELVRSFEDGQYVFVHAYQSLNNGESEWVTMDFFDTDKNDKIIEHWDVIAAFGGKNSSGHTQVDGSTEIMVTDDTESNKATVRAMIQDLLMPGGNIDNASYYISETYLQHGPDVVDGLGHFLSLLQAESRPRWYHEIVLLVGCGNFIATLSKTTWKEQAYAQADLFRLEAGKIVEHWEAAEPVPSSEELVNSGKF